MVLALQNPFDGLDLGPAVLQLDVLTRLKEVSLHLLCAHPWPLPNDALHNSVILLVDALCLLLLKQKVQRLMVAATRLLNCAPLSLRDVEQFVQ